MRSKKALRNMLSSLALQFVSMVCGLILPRLLIRTFGSSVNGMVASITQFLGYIVLFEAGVGGVVRAALYKPLADSDMPRISSILRASDRFFRRVAWIFVGYAAAVACIYPFIVRGDGFAYLFTLSLVVIIAVSTFFQYYFGMSRQVLLQADQKRYVTSDLQIVTILLNTALCVVLIRLHASIHVVKLGTAAVYALRPLLLRWIVRRQYAPDAHAAPDASAIAQRWDGFGHHTAYFLHTNTDVFVLTLFSAWSRAVQIADVSVYTVYYSVVAGIEKIVSAFSSGIEAAFGNMIAREETETLRRNFCVYEFFSFTLVTVLFTCAGILLQPFIAVYTRGVTDAQYLRPMFGVLLAAAEAVYCIRIPYNNVTLAAGHYRQTRNGAFLEAGINVVLSVALVIPLGLSGVALATLVAMTVRTVQYALYLSRHILRRPFAVFLGRCAVNLAACGLSVLSCVLLPRPEIADYLRWALYAVPVFLICGVWTLLLNSLFYREDLRNLWTVFRHSIQKRRIRS
ncbi:MAG: sugar isomerase [Clostridia bacterium]|nr:sugar isomerase [Clostridia bacterium]